MFRFAALLKPLLFLITFYPSCATTFAKPPHKTSAPQQLSYKILETTEHNPKSFTQGLERHGPNLIESSGLYGKSFLSVYSIGNDKVIYSSRLPKSIFAEGLTVFKNRIYLLSWQAQTAYVFDSKSYRFIKTIPYKGQGWGLTHNETQLIMSNGSSHLTFLDPQTFAVESSLQVHSVNKRWDYINELEYARGLIWANIWQSNEIIAIDPVTGRVEGIVDLSKLALKHTRYAGYDVLNGIAYNAEDDSFWITGKLWSKRYRVQVQQPNSHRTKHSSYYDK